MPEGVKQDDSAEVHRLRPYVERARAFSGWDLDRIGPQRIGPAVPWDYKRRAQELSTRASSTLDLGTGGGELLAEICEGYHGRATASEQWAVNTPIAKRRLSSLGVEVVRAHSLRLPFQDAAFDLVLDRHEELEPREVHRILRPGGIVLTQQIGRNEWNELRTFFPRMQDFGPLFEQYVSGLEETGMTVATAKTHDTLAAYRGLGELVYLLCISPWTIPDFDPLGKDLGSLLQIEARLGNRGGLVLTESRFLIEARR